MSGGSNRKNLSARSLSPPMIRQPRRPTSSLRNPALRHLHPCGVSTRPALGGRHGQRPSATAEDAKVNPRCAEPLPLGIDEMPRDCDRLAWNGTQPHRFVQLCSHSILGRRWHGEHPGASDENREQRNTSCGAGSSSLKPSPSRSLARSAMESFSRRPLDGSALAESSEQPGKLTGWGTLHSAG